MPHITYWWKGSGGNEAEWTKKAENRKADFLIVGEAIKAISMAYFGLQKKRETLTVSDSQNENIMSASAYTPQGDIPTANRDLLLMSVSCLVSWCLEPSQPQRITLGLKTNFNLSPNYSFHKSLYRKSLFPKPQLKFYPQFRNVNQEKQLHMFWSLFTFLGHSTREPASSRVTYFILRVYTGTDVSHSQHRKKSGEVWKKCRWMDRKGRN